MRFIVRGEGGLCGLDDDERRAAFNELLCHHTQFSAISVAIFSHQQQNSYDETTEKPIESPASHNTA